ncbi:MAG TPA: protein kinase [Vicinamibacterales bacterium]|nr:protein kinase [Vicinamibacterales bacterium]
MKITYGELSSTGPVRPHNEDYVAYWEPETDQARTTRGAVALLADGVGGQGFGEIASRLAIDTALKVFQEADPSTTDNQLLWRMFNAANLAVYDAGMAQGGTDRMATTLTVSLFRRNEVAVGHVGDSRSYLVRQGTIKQLTADHAYVAMQVKMGLISKQDAMTSELRGLLTRSIGANPTVQVDYAREVLRNGDIVVQCSDGLHGCVTENEIRDYVSRMPPVSACEQLSQLATKRGSEDNISVQVLRVDNVQRVGYYRGAVAYYAPVSKPASDEPQVGQVFDERFEIIDIISRSGMSSVYKATDLKSGTLVALKVPHLKLESDPAFFSRFEREEEIGRQLNHPGIIRIIPVDPGARSRPYLVMEYLQGQTLDEVMQVTSPMPEKDALQIASRLCDALDYMHTHDVIHRDLKPQNVMLCNDGSLRIMDFGIAKAASSKRITFGGFSPTLGTPDYMAPEQVKGQRGDQRTDIYSLGAILYEMLTGRLPFEGPNAYAVMNARLVGDPAAPRVQNPSIRPEVEEIVLHSMARNPEDRYASAAAFKADLDRPEHVHVTGRASRLQVPVMAKRTWRIVRIALLTALVPIALFFLLFFMLSHRAHG